MNKKIRIVIIIFLVMVLIFLVGSLLYKDNLEQKEENKIRNTITEIKKHYNNKVITDKETKLYILNNNNYEEVGMVSDNVVLSLKDININTETKYFITDTFSEEYYIYYEDVIPSNDTEEVDYRYRNYIPFDENIVTGDITEFYSDGNLIYRFNKSFDLPVIIKEDNSYFVEFNNRLLEVKKDNVVNTYSNNNSEIEKAKSIRVIAYHAFYDKDDENEKWCRTEICHPTTQVEEQSKYLKENNYFTLNTKELSWFIDGKINVPKKSIMITIDDGLLAERGLEVFDRYELNATLFLITSLYKPESYIKSKYIEYHSHGNDLHKVGVCPGGQGGGIKCLDKNVLIEDLKTSSEILGGSTVFCYPFYEFNNYSISVLKEAGYTMAFAGLVGNGRVTTGTNKYIIPRYTITSDVSLEEFIDIVK